VSCGVCDAVQLLAAFPESEISEYIVLVLYHLSTGLPQVCVIVCVCVCVCVCLCVCVCVSVCV
jgi:hypothetical protein